MRRTLGLVCVCLLLGYPPAAVVGRQPESTSLTTSRLPFSEMRLLSRFRAGHQYLAHRRRLGENPQCRQQPNWHARVLLIPTGADPAGPHIHAHGLRKGRRHQRVGPRKYQLVRGIRLLHGQAVFDVASGWRLGLDPSCLRQQHCPTLGVSAHVRAHLHHTLSCGWNRAPALPVAVARFGSTMFNFARISSDPELSRNPPEAIEYRCSSGS